MCRRGTSEMAKNINYPVDKKSGQVINGSICISPLHKTKAASSEVFNEDTANSLIGKYATKKSSSAPVNFLVDRIRFTKKDFHEYLNYREIQNFHRSQTYPGVFVLFVAEESKGAKTYECYRCDKPSDVLNVRDMIAAAHGDSKRLLMDVGPTRLLSVSSSSSSEYYLENKQDNRTPRARSIPYMNSEPMMQHQYMYPNVESPMAVYRKPMMTRPYSRPPSAEPRADLVRMPSVRNAGGYDRNATSSAGNDVTYLRSDNIHGPQISDHGPVYMYVSRSRQQLNQNDWSPDPSYSRRNGYYQ